jgi:hypothetical protein
MAINKKKNGHCINDKSIICSVPDILCDNCRMAHRGYRRVEEFIREWDGGDSS